MKNLKRISTILMLLICVGLSQKSFAIGGGVSAVTVGSQTGTVTQGTAGSATYSVTLTYSNLSTSTISTSTTLTLTSWTPPTGASTSFSNSFPFSWTMSSGSGLSQGMGTLTISTTSSTPAGSYTFKVTETTNSITVTSTTVNFVVGGGCTSPSIGSQSTGTQTQCINGTFTPISVSATGTGLSYQWYSNASASNTGGATLNSSNGAQTNSYTPQATVAGTKYYYCVVTGTCGTVTSSVSGAFNTNPTRVFVTTLGAGTNDGSSWANAFSGSQLQMAINQTCVTEVWVAAGTYKPTTGSDRTISFQMKNGVSIYGGFAGTEANLVDRNIATNTTILSGDIGTVSNASDNSYHVINHPYGLGLGSTAVLDGFTIRDGNANGSGDQTYGGGIYNNGNSPTIRNCNISYNSASGNAGGIYNINGSNGSFSNISFTNNQSSITSGAVNNNASSPTFDACTFSSNSTVYGGGAVVDESSSNAVYTNCMFSSNNVTTGTGGALYVSASTSTLTNCIINGNTTSVFGGAAYLVSNGNATFINCTIYGNSANNGGGIYATGASLIVSNSIVWGNTITTNVNQGAQFCFVSGTNSLQYSCYSNSSGDVYGSATTTTSCITSDPMFVSRSTSNLRVFGISPCVDAGNNAYNSQSYDIRGTGYGRKLNKANGTSGTIDMGAYEYKYASDQNCSSSYEVTNTNDSGDGSLRYAISVLCDNGTITFNSSLNASSITLLSGELFIDKGLTIDATSLANGIAVDGNSTSRAFDIQCTSSASVTIKNIKVKHGYSSDYGGGIYVGNSNSSVTLRNDSILNCSAVYGGGIYQDNGTLNVSHCVFNQNTTTYSAGAIYFKTTGTIDTSTFTYNSSTYEGGAVFQESGNVVCTGSTFSHNLSQWGGVEFIQGGTSTNNYTTFSNNSCNNSNPVAGAFWHDNGTLNLNNCSITNNTVGNLGGGIYVSNGTANLNISGGTISSNTSTNGNGGGIYINNGSVKINNQAIVSYNTAPLTSGNGLGGGIFLNNGTLTIDTSYINHNSAYSKGGGIYVSTSTASITATGDSISYNSSQTDVGGGIYFNSGTSNFKRTIVSGNTNNKQGAGIYFFASTTTPVIDSCTFTSNVTSNNATDVNYGGAIFINTGGANISNSSFSANKATHTSSLRTPKGGAIYLFQGTLNSTKNTFTSNVVNTSRSLGGAIFNDQGTLNNYSCTFTTDSSGKSGGAVYNNNAASVTTDSACTFTSNYAATYGGAIFLLAGTINNAYCTFTTNKTGSTASATGGAIYQSANTTNTRACTFNGNQAYYGGAIGVSSGTANVINSLFYSNTSINHGGALGTEAVGATLNITNCTIYGNSAQNSSNAGGVGVYNGTVNIKNSVLWANTASSGAQIYRSAGTVTINNSDYKNGTGDITGTVTANNCINTYPDFVNIATNDFRLAGNSPCLDAGNNSYTTEAYDIRGASFTRKLNKNDGTSGTIDMGAYEYVYNSDPIFSGPDNPIPFAATTNGAWEIDLTWILNANSNNVIVAFNSSNTFGTPTGTYIAGNSISGGGTVLYAGSNTSFNHTSLSQGTTYYYKAWSIDGNSVYSTGTSANATTIACVNPTSGGTIGNAQTNCGSFDPSAITSAATPSGHTGTLEYKWQSSISGSGSGFSDISGATSSTYDPSSLSQTTWYKRISRVSCMNNWTGAAESNVIAMTVNPVPSATATPDIIACHGGTTSVVVVGSGGSGTFTAGTGTYTSVAAGGPYTYTITDNNGCTATSSASITEPATLTASSSGNAILCRGGSTAVTVSAIGGTTSYNGVGTYTVTAGTYSYTVTDAHSCSSVTSLTISQPATAISISSSQGPAITCFGGTTTVSVTGSGGTGSLTNLGTYTRSAGIYTFTVTDANNCVATTTQTITQPNNVTFTSSAVNPTPCTSANGRITVLAAGGSGFYSYSKTGGSTWQSSTAFLSLASGTYTMQVKDSRNCTSAKANVRVGCLARLDGGVDEEISSTFNIYPNPANDHLTIDFSSDNAENYSLHLMDMIGQTIISDNKTSVVGDNQIQLNLNGLAKGIYILNIQKGDANMIKKIIVQ